MQPSLPHLESRNTGRMIGKTKAHTTASLEIRLPNLQATLEPRICAKLGLCLQINLIGLGWTKGRFCLTREFEVQILNPGKIGACMHFVT